MILPSKREVAAVYNVLARVGIAEKLYQRTDQLSGGQQQRVAVARALYQDPLALLADEPVSSVDPARARSAVDLFTTVSQDSGLTLVMSLHNVALAREFFPRLIGLKHGRIQFDKRSSDLEDEEVQELFHLESAEILENGSS